MSVISWYQRSTNLFIVLLVSAARLDQDETFDTFDLFFAQRFALPVLDGKRVVIPVYVFERGKDFTYVLLTILNGGATWSELGSDRKMVFVAAGITGVRIDTPVTTPRVPSAPMNICFRSYPGVRQIVR